MSTSRNRTRPSSGARNPLITSKSVVFPAPFGPMTPTISISLTEMDASYRARMPPKLTVQPSTSSMGLDSIARNRDGRRRLLRGGRRPAQPAPDGAEHLPEPTRAAGQAEDEQERADHEGGEVGRQVGENRNGVDGAGQLQLVEEVVGQGEEGRAHDHSGPAAQAAHDGHDHEDQRQPELELAGHD